MKSKGAGRGGRTRQWERIMKSYVFKVVIEPDEEGWRAFYPPWEHIGASTWGYDQERAVKNIGEVLTMLLEEFEEEGKTVIAEEGLEIVEDRTLVTVNL